MKKSLSFILAVVMMLSCFVGMTVTTVADETTPAIVPFVGSGTLEDPYLIQNANDFKTLTDLFNASTT